MSVRNAGKTIREARIKAGLTQEQLQAEQTLTVSIPSIVRASIWVPGS